MPTAILPDADDLILGLAGGAAAVGARVVGLSF